MKNLLILSVCLTTILFSATINAQQQNIPVNEPNYNKPRLFDNLPARIPFNVESFESIFSLAKGTNVNFNLSDNAQFQFAGEVISHDFKYDNKIESVIIKSSNYQGANFTFSKSTDINNKTTYTGRILSLHHGDLYVLKSEKDGFVLIKKNFYDLVNE